MRAFAALQPAAHQLDFRSVKPGTSGRMRLLSNKQQWLCSVLDWWPTEACGTPQTFSPLLSAIPIWHIRKLFAFIICYIRDDNLNLLSFSWSSAGCWGCCFAEDSGAQWLLLLEPLIDALTYLLTYVICYAMRNNKSNASEQGKYHKLNKNS